MAAAGLFPGQGSQVVGMGSAFAKTPEAKEIFEQADSALGFRLSDLCFNGPMETLTLTENAQPAILTVSYLAFQAANMSLQAAAGHSLGEYTALVAAGCLSFADAVRLVHNRGRYMQEAVEPGLGKMVAVLGPKLDEVEALIQGVESGVVEVANVNTSAQTVVAGDVEGVDAFSALVVQAGAKVVPLPVSAPFHCTLMQPAAEKLAPDLDAVSFSDPEFPVYANVTGRPVATGDEARELLKQQVCATVRWTDCVENLISDHSITHAVEFGAGGVLSRMMKRIDRKVKTLELSAPEHIVAVREALS